MKRLASLALSLVMLLILTIPAARAAEAAPTPPDWVKAEEYAVFDDGEAYQPENWERILRLRADAAAGNPAPRQGAAMYDDYRALQSLSSGGNRTGSASIEFEVSLLDLRYRCNMLIKPPVFSQGWPRPVFDRAAEDGAGQEPQVYLARLWALRSQFIQFANLASGSSDDMRAFVRSVQAMYDAYPQFQSAEVVEWDMARLAPEEYREMVRDGMIVVTLDGRIVHPAILTYSPVRHEASFACVREGCTMVPVRRLAEMLGATVHYAAGKLTLTRAGTTVVMTVGGRSADVNGTVYQLAAAPFQENGRIYIPVRDLGAFFGQKLEWVNPRELAVTENKAAAGNSNLEAWALPMGAMLNDLNRGHSGSESAERITLFGGAPRAEEFVTAGGIYGYGMREGARFGREIALNALNGASWGINSRDDLIGTVCSMTYHGHNENFLSDAAYFKSLSSADYQRMLKNAGGMDQYMIPYTVQLGEKWGDRGILCWDLFRMSNLVQWGYMAGYLTYPEALALLEPAAELLHDNFKSWDEAYENYLDGYNWWARNNVLNKDVWTTERGKIYQRMKDDPAAAKIFDDALFRRAVAGVPGVTAAGLLAGTV